MNNLQTYLKIKGISATDVAAGTGLGYHSVQKNIKGLRNNRVVREAIARHLDLPYTHIFGSASGRHIRKLIQHAIKETASQRARAEQQRLERKYLNHSRQILEGHQHAVNA